MPFVKIAEAGAVGVGEVMEASVGGRYYAVCNVGGEIHCLDGECPCTGGPLSQGAIRDELLVCPWHGWRFHYDTGVCLYDENMKVAKFPAKVEDGGIWIDVEHDVDQDVEQDVKQCVEQDGKGE